MVALDLHKFKLNFCKYHHSIINIYPIGKSIRSWYQSEHPHVFSSKLPLINPLVLLCESPAISIHLCVSLCPPTPSPHQRPLPSSTHCSPCLPPLCNTPSQLYYVRPHPRITLHAAAIHIHPIHLHPRPLMSTSLPSRIPPFSSRLAHNTIPFPSIFKNNI